MALPQFPAFSKVGLKGPVLLEAKESQGRWCVLCPWCAERRACFVLCRRVGLVASRGLSVPAVSAPLFQDRPLGHSTSTQASIATPVVSALKKLFYCTQPGLAS